jgi:nucleotide-binding universal stress UspA family protein
MMPNIRHILYPIDFSDRCKAIRPLVQAMAARFHAKITLMHALQIPATFYPALDTAYAVEFDMDEMRDDAEEKLAAFYGVPRHPAPCGIEIAVDTGDPASSIVEFAAANEVDLIMLSTHGYGRYRALLLGSIASKVLHDTAIPVWTAAHTENPVLASHSKCESILCALDLNPGSLDLLRKSVEVAASFGAKLRIVHAVPGADPGPDSYLRTLMPDADFRQFLLRAGREEVLRLQMEAGTKLELCIEGGDVSKVVKAAAEHHQADLVIIGRGKLHSHLGRLRTHAYAIVRDSPCPVLSI